MTIRDETFLRLLDEAIADEERMERWHRGRDEFELANDYRAQAAGLRRARRLWVSFTERQEAA